MGHASFLCSLTASRNLVSSHRAEVLRLTPSSHHLTSRPPPTWVLRMNLPDDEHAFLKELVKASRQKIHHVTWIDRDGTERKTALTQAEVARLNAIAQRLKTSKSDVLRQAAHIPVAK